MPLPHTVLIYVFIVVIAKTVGSERKILTNEESAKLSQIAEHIFNVKQSQVLDLGAIINYSKTIEDGISTKQNQTIEDSLSTKQAQTTAGILLDSKQTQTPPNLFIIKQIQLNTSDYNKEQTHSQASHDNEKLRWEKKGFNDNQNLAKIRSFKQKGSTSDILNAKQTSGAEHKLKGKRNDNPKAKRQYELGEVFLHSDLDLLQNGMLLARHQQPDLLALLGGELFDQPAIALILPEQRNVHQYQEDLPTSVPRNPTKPLYHYTPLPKGTFPAPKGDMEHSERHISQESHSTHEINPSYLLGYRLHAAHQEPGRQGHVNGHLLQGSYQLLLPSSNLQIVQYLSNSHGYHPSIAYL